VKDECDAERMRAAAKGFVGFHDFRAFSDDDPAPEVHDGPAESFDVHEDEDLWSFTSRRRTSCGRWCGRLVGVLVERARAR
jgi:tRNA U38,U39,U40 pseudouridine synthase TruA